MQVVEERFTFGGTALVVERPGNPADMIDEERFARDEYMPYWAEIWPAGVELARHVAGLDLTGLAVLELGCGLGLPSMVAALRGARVTATDWSPEAIAALRANAARNGAAITAVVHDWRDIGALSGARFDVVLAADVLYEERNARPLLHTIAAALADDGQALLADPGRRHAEGFAELASAWGLDSAALDHRLSAAGRLLRLRRDTVLLG
jgi:predicted nicotinamide N-methyase